MPRSVGPLIASALAPFLGMACNGNALPGTSLGTYSVTGDSTTNTCGPGAMAPNPWTFDVQMSEDGSTLYWSWLDGSPFLSAPIDATSSATLTMSQQQNVDGTSQSAGPCNLERDDTIDVTLATGSPPPTFTGSISYTFSPVAGSDCGDQLSVTGGPYDTLPCTIAYDVTGTRQ